jgi:hypothetical protein
MRQHGLRRRQARLAGWRGVSDIEIDSEPVSQPEGYAEPSCKFGNFLSVQGFDPFTIAGLPQQTSLSAGNLANITVPHRVRFAANHMWLDNQPNPQAVPFVAPSPRPNLSGDFRDRN